MAIGVIWHPPVDQQIYDAVNAKVRDRVGDDLGMRFHAAGQADDGWRIIEVWDSREALDGFIRDHLAPAVEEVSQGQAPSPQPEHVFEVHNQGP